MPLKPISEAREELYERYPNSTKMVEHLLFEGLREGKYSYDSDDLPDVQRWAYQHVRELQGSDTNPWSSWATDAIKDIPHLGGTARALANVAGHLAPSPTSGVLAPGSINKLKETFIGESPVREEDKDWEEALEYVQGIDKAVANSAMLDIYEAIAEDNTTAFNAESQEIFKELERDLILGKKTSEEAEAIAESRRVQWEPMLNRAAEEANEIASSLFYMDDEENVKAFGPGGDGWKKAVRDRRLGIGIVAVPSIVTGFGPFLGVGAEAAAATAAVGAGARLSSIVGRMGWKKFFARTAGLWGMAGMEGLKKSPRWNPLSIKHRREHLKKMMTSGEFSVPTYEGFDTPDIPRVAAENYIEGTKDSWSGVEAAEVAHKLIISGEDPANGAKALFQINERINAEINDRFSLASIAKGVGHFSGDAAEWALAGRVSAAHSVGSRGAKMMFGELEGLRGLKKHAASMLTHQLDNVVTFSTVNAMNGDVEHMGHAIRDAVFFGTLFPANSFLRGKAGWIGGRGMAGIEGGLMPFLDPVTDQLKNNFFGGDRDVHWPTGAEVSASSAEFAFGTAMMHPSLGTNWRSAPHSVERARRLSTKIPLLRPFDITLRATADFFTGPLGGQDILPPNVSPAKAKVNYRKYLSRILPDKTETSRLPSGEGLDGSKSVEGGAQQVEKDLETLKSTKPKRLIGKILSSHVRASIETLKNRALYIIEHTNIARDSSEAAIARTILKAADQALGLGTAKGGGDAPRFAVDSKSGNKLVRYGHEVLDGVGGENSRDAYRNWRQGRFDKQMDDSDYIASLTTSEERFEALRELNELTGDTPAAREAFEKAKAQEEAQKTRDIIAELAREEGRPTEGEEFGEQAELLAKGRDAQEGGSQETRALTTAEHESLDNIVKTAERDFGEPGSRDGTEVGDIWQAAMDRLNGLDPAVKATREWGEAWSKLSKLNRAHKESIARAELEALGAAEGQEGEEHGPQEPTEGAGADPQTEVIEGIKQNAGKRGANVSDYIGKLNLSPEEARKLKEEIRFDGSGDAPVLSPKQRKKALEALEDIIRDPDMLSEESIERLLEVFDPASESTEGQQKAEGPAADTPKPKASPADGKPEASKDTTKEGSPAKESMGPQEYKKKWGKRKAEASEETDGKEQEADKAKLKQTLEGKTEDELNKIKQEVEESGDLRSDEGNVHKVANTILSFAKALLEPFNKAASLESAPWAESGKTHGLGRVQQLVNWVLKNPNGKNFEDALKEVQEKFFSGLTKLQLQAIERKLQGLVDKAREAEPFGFEEGARETGTDLLEKLRDAVNAAPIEPYYNREKLGTVGLTGRSQESMDSARAWGQGNLRGEAGRVRILGAGGRQRPARKPPTSEQRAETPGEQWARETANDYALTLGADKEAKQTFRDKVDTADQSLLETLYNHLEKRLAAARDFFRASKEQVDAASIGIVENKKGDQTTEIKDQSDAKTLAEKLKRTSGLTLTTDSAPGINVLNENASSGTKKNSSGRWDVWEKDSEGIWKNTGGNHQTRTKAREKGFLAELEAKKNELKKSERMTSAHQMHDRLKAGRDYVHGKLDESRRKPHVDTEGDGPDINQPRHATNQDPRIASVKYLREYLEKGQLPVEVVEKLIGKIESLIEKIANNPNQRFTQTEAIRKAIDELLASPDLKDKWRGQKTEEELGSDGQPISIPYIGDTLRLAFRVIGTELNTVKYNTGKYEESLIVDSTGAVVRHTGKHPVTGNDLQSGGMNSWLSMKWSESKENIFGRLVGYVGKKVKGEEEEFIDVSFFRYYSDGKTAGELIEAQNHHFLQLLNASNFSPEKGVKNIAGIIGADSSTPVVVFMPESVRNMEAGDVQNKIKGLYGEQKELEAQIAKDKEALGLEKGGAQSEYYDRMVVGMDAAFKEVFGKGYYKQLIESGQLDTAAKIVKRFKIVGSRGKGSNVKGFRSSDGVQTFGAKDEFDFIIAEEPSYGGRKDSLDGYVAVSHELWEALSTIHGWEKGTTVSKDFAHTVHETLGAFGLKGALHKATSAEQSLMGSDGIDLIVYDNAAKYWGDRKKVTLDFSGKNVTIPKGTTLEHKYKLPMDDLRHLYAERPSKLRKGTTGLPKQLLGLIHTLAIGGSKDSYAETTKYILDTLKDIKEFSKDLNSKSGDALVKFIKEQDLDIDLDDVGEAEDMYNLHPDVVTRLDMVRTMFGLASRANRSGSDKRLRSRILSAYSRAKVSGAHAYLRPMHKNYEQYIAKAVIEKHSGGRGGAGEKQLRQDEILLSNEHRKTLKLTAIDANGEKIEGNIEDRVNSGEDVWVVVPRVPIQSGYAIPVLRVAGFAPIGTGVVMHPERVKKTIAGDHDGDKVFLLADLPSSLVTHLKDSFNNYDKETGVPQKWAIIPGEPLSGELSRYAFAPKSFDYSLGSSLSPYTLFTHTMAVHKSMDSLGALVGIGQQTFALYRHAMLKSPEGKAIKLTSFGDDKITFTPKKDLTAEEMRIVEAIFEQGVNLFVDAQPVEGNRDHTDFLSMMIERLFEVEGLTHEQSESPEVKHNIIVSAFTKTKEMEKLRDLLGQIKKKNTSFGYLLEASKAASENSIEGSLLYDLLKDIGKKEESGGWDADVINPSRYIDNSKWTTLAHKMRGWKEVGSNGELLGTDKLWQWVSNSIHGENSDSDGFRGIHQQDIIGQGRTQIQSALQNNAKLQRLMDIRNPTQKQKDEIATLKPRVAQEMAQFEALIAQWNLIAGKMAQFEMLRDNADKNNEDPLDYAERLQPDIDTNNEVARLLQFLWVANNNNKNFELTDREVIGEDGAYTVEAGANRIMELLYGMKRGPGGEILEPGEAGIKVESGTSIPTAWNGDAGQLFRSRREVWKRADSEGVRTVLRVDDLSTPETPERRQEKREIIIGLVNEYYRGLADLQNSSVLKAQFRLAMMTPAMLPSEFGQGSSRIIRYQPVDAGLGYRFSDYNWGANDYRLITNKSREMFKYVENIKTPQVSSEGNYTYMGMNLFGGPFGPSEGEPLIDLNQAAETGRRLATNASNRASGIANKGKEAIEEMLESPSIDDHNFSTIRNFIGWVRETGNTGHAKILRNILATRYAKLTDRPIRDESLRAIGVKGDDFSFEKLEGDSPVARDLRRTAVAIIGELRRLEHTGVGDYTIITGTGNKIVMTPSGLARMMDSGVAHYLLEDKDGNLVDSKTTFLLPGTKMPGGWFSFLASTMANTPAMAQISKRIMQEGSTSNRLISSLPFSREIFKSVGTIHGINNIKKKALATLGSTDPKDIKELDEFAWHLIQYRDSFPVLGTPDMIKMLNSWLFPTARETVKDDLNEVEREQRIELAAKHFPRAFDKASGKWNPRYVAAAREIIEGWFNDSQTMGEYAKSIADKTDAANREINKHIINEVRNHLIGRSRSKEFVDRFDELLYEVKGRIEAHEVTERDPYTGKTRIVTVESLNPSAGKYAIDTKKLRTLQEKMMREGRSEEFIELAEELRNGLKEINGSLKALFNFEREVEAPMDREGRLIESPTLGDWVFFGRPYVPKDMKADISENRRTDAVLRRRGEKQRKRTQDRFDRNQEALDVLMMEDSVENRAEMAYLEIKQDRARRALEHWNRTLDVPIEQREQEHKEAIVAGQVASAGRTRAMQAKRVPSPLPLDQLMERGFDPDNPRQNRLVPSGGLLHSWENYIDTIGQAMPVGLAEARARLVKYRLPHHSQRVEAERLIRIGSGDPIRHLLLQFGMLGVGVNADFGEHAMLRRVNIPIKAWNKFKRGINKAAGGEVLKETKEEKTFDRQKYWSEMDGMLAVIRFLSAPSTAVNNLAAIKNNYIFLGQKNPFNGGFLNDNDVVRREVGLIFDRGNHGASVEKIIDDLDLASKAEHLHPYVRDVLEAMNAGGDVNFGKRMAAWGLIYGIGLPGITNPVSTLAMSPARFNKNVRSLLGSRESRQAHRALVAKSFPSSFFISWSESRARQISWRAASSDYIGFMKHLRHSDRGPGFLNPEDPAQYEKDQLAVIDYANRYTDMTNYIFNQWGQPEFFKTSLGRMAGRFRSWMPQEHELMLKVWGAHGLRPDRGLARTSFLTPYNLGLLSRKEYGQMEEIQQRWARAQSTAVILSIVPRIMSNLGISPGMVGMFNYGVMSQFAGGFGRNMNTPTVEFAWMTFDVAQAITNLFYANNDKQRDKAFDVIDSMMRATTNANVSAGIMTWLRCYAMLMDGDYRGSEIARGLSGFPLMVGAPVYGTGGQVIEAFDND